MPETTLLHASDADQPDQRVARTPTLLELSDGATARRAWHDQAVAHVDRAMNVYPWLRGIDREMYIGIVEWHPA